MIVVCIGCRRQGLPSVQRELMPYEDTRLLATLCVLHAEELRARLRALAERERQAQGEAGGMSAPAVCPWCWGEHAECPYSAEEARAVRMARKARQAARKGSDSGALETASSGPRIPGTSGTIFRNGRAFRPGRPRVPVQDQRQKARARVRAYRQRRRAKGGAA